MDSHEARARSFGSVAPLYDRVRPSYPSDALDWALAGKTPGRALDLGAGTGKLSALLRARGWKVIAIDPTEGMCRQFHHILVDIGVIAGTAEALPLREAAFDLVIVGQAWHWFDEETAASEISRVLTSNGRLVVVNNFRDESIEWVRELSRLVDGLGQEMERSVAFGARFDYFECAHFSWHEELSVADVVDLFASRSYVLVRAEAEREELLSRVAQIAKEVASQRESGLISFPYRTQCIRATVVDSKL